MKHITIPALSDMHVHFRQGGVIRQVAPHTARYAGRVLAMPNTMPPIADALDALNYGQTLRQRMPGVDVLVAAKLLPTTTPDMILHTAELRSAEAYKLYPAGATTHSADGISADILRKPDQHTAFGDLLDAMERHDFVLCLHGEMPAERNPLTREIEFLPFVSWVLDRFPRLRVVMEHISTRQAVDFVLANYQRGCHIAATLTVHHVLLHLGHLFGTAFEDDWGYSDGKLHPHHFCWPCLKEPSQMDALRGAALSGVPCFFAGSDSAPHAQEDKESACGCAGVFSAPVLPELWVDFFSLHDAMALLPNFLTHHADRFYDRKPVGRTLRMEQDSWTVPAIAHGTSSVPLMAGKKLRWRLAE